LAHLNVEGSLLLEVHHVACGKKQEAAIQGEADANKEEDGHDQNDVDIVGQLHARPGESRHEPERQSEIKQRHKVDGTYHVLSAIAIIS
jgi:hypothetical protein